MPGVRIHRVELHWLGKAADKAKPVVCRRVRLPQPELFNSRAQSQSWSLLARANAVPERPYGPHKAQRNLRSKTATDGNHVEFAAWRSF